MQVKERTIFSEAEGYERYLGPWSSSLAPRFIDFAGVQDGDRVLDVGSGTGSLSLALAAKTSGSEIVGIDPSAPYVEFARTRTRDPRVRFQVGDAMSLPFANNYFDKSLAQLVISFVPNAQGAVREMCRVTKAGGVVAACTWIMGKDNERNRIFWEAATAADPAAAQWREKEGGYGRGGRLSAIWAECGLKEIKEADLTVSVDFASFEEFWLPHLEGQGRAAAYVKSLSPDRQEALRERLRHDLLGTGAERPFSVQGKALAVRGIC